MSKLLLQKKSRVTFYEDSQKKRNVIITFFSCDFGKSMHGKRKSLIFQDGSIILEKLMDSQ